jgi:GxxExxY protein
MFNNKILYPKEGYEITGICFRVQKEIGRFGRERQYCDLLEEFFKELSIPYLREFEIKNFVSDSPKGNRVDFLVYNKIIIEVKAKNFVTKEDYIQLQRYLKAANLELGLLINFRSVHLKPYRVLNSEFYSGHSNLNSEHSDR